MMSRVSSIPTYKLWNISEEMYLYTLQQSGTIQVLSEYYSMGIKLAMSATKDVMGTHKYSELTNEDLELIKQRESLVSFYEDRLIELKLL